MSDLVLNRARAALRSEPRLRPSHTAIHLEFSEGAMTVEGEVENVAAKKLALEHIAAVPGVTGILDRLRVSPAQKMGDGKIRALVRDSLLQDPALSNLTIQIVDKGGLVMIREIPGGGVGSITLRVEDGIVTLDGEVPGLAQKRLAGVLAWWVPGSRDVINGLGVEPPEEDNDLQIKEAVQIALDKDPFVDASQVRVSVRDRIVTLQGLVPFPSEREMAESDAWYVFGVDRVINAILVGR
jgi:osmotically-inducible protein OsmY